ncbi:hypothetical protein IFM89_011301 [Coptis chinensis]|uniref:Ribulose-1,5-bisphosphate carboxylase small subunit N-terminal domain-containing protein n=1 Tax=Coptis chinensis TaxID=261450 RepID=A0A835HT91_9MAGN|nr:hypothetical protein IFM89_011301 [Coptis chinensis]
MDQENEERLLISSCCMPLASINNCATPAQASMVAPFTGLKSTSLSPIPEKVNNITSISSNGGKSFLHAGGSFFRHFVPEHWRHGGSL